MFDSKPLEKTLSFQVLRRGSNDIDYFLREMDSKNFTMESLILAQDER